MSIENPITATTTDSVNTKNRHHFEFVAFFIWAIFFNSFNKTHFICVNFGRKMADERTKSYVESSILCVCDGWFYHLFETAAAAAAATTATTNVCCSIERERLERWIEVKKSVWVSECVLYLHMYEMYSEKSNKTYSKKIIKFILTVAGWLADYSEIFG